VVLILIETGFMILGRRALMPENQGRFLIPAAARLALATLLLLPLAAGCAGGGGVGKVVPVAGKVLLDNKPLTAGAVTFVPDAAKGNKARATATGLIKEDGTYELTTETKPGAPPGPYKVTIQTMFPGGQMPAKPVQINSKFTSPDTTPLLIEVSENPPAGAYDLQVSR